MTRSQNNGFIFLETKGKEERKQWKEKSEERKKEKFEMSQSSQMIELTYLN